MSDKKEGNLASRQKQYEEATGSKLVPKVPVIIRVDGKSFHTFTKGLNKPFDKVIINSMINTTTELCSELQGCKLGYTQSDEITIVFPMKDRYIDESLFSGRVQKVVSTVASKATRIFNKNFREQVDKLIKDGESENDLKKYINKLDKAEFDARVFNVPEWDCINNIIWRQQDAIRNSIASVGHAYLSSSKIKGLNSISIKKMLIEEKDLDWESYYDEYCRQGLMCCNIEYVKQTANGDVLRHKWITKEIGTTLDNERELFSEITGLIE